LFHVYQKGRNEIATFLLLTRSPYTYSTNYMIKQNDLDGVNINGHGRPFLSAQDVLSGS